MKQKSRRSPSYPAGFTLVEIMVGLAIGMLATLVILQVMSAFEAQKRTTTGSADAQTNGSIALYTIERELQMAGYPLLPVTDSPLECASLTIGGVAGSTDRLSPVTITDGAAGASDTITLRYGTTATGGVPTQITLSPVASAATAAPARDVTVAGSVGCAPNDKMLITNGTACTMSDVVAVPNTTTVTFADTTVATTAVTSAAAVTGLNLACLGTWNEIAYRANGGNLERQNLAASATFVPSVTGIVNIQAQYGISAAGLANTDSNFNRVTQWVDATTAAGWDAPTVTNRNRIKAVRIAVVARNEKMELTDVTTACTSTTAAAPTGLCAWAGSAASPAPTITLRNDPDGTSWRRYRYRVFETIIPLRNVIWAKSTL